MPSPGAAARFIAALVAAVWFAALAAVGLWAHDHAGRRDAALNAHAQLVLHDLTAALEARLTIGLPLVQLPDVDRLLEAARLQLPMARAATVLDETGRGVFSTDTMEVGERLLDAAAARVAGRRSDGVDDIFWAPVSNDDGAAAGAVLLRLPAGAGRDGVTDFALSLLARATPALAGLTGLAALLGYWLSRAVSRPAAQTAAVLEGLALDPADGANVVVAAPAGTPLAAFVAAVTARRDRLAAAEDELGRLDETA